MNMIVKEEMMTGKHMANQMKMDSQMKIDDAKVGEFRELIRKIKKTVIENNVYTTQDPDLLNKIQEFFAKELYSILLPVIRGEKDISTIQDEKFKSLFAKILSPPTSQYLRGQLEYYLHRDFIMFPFAYDAKSINAQA